MRREILRIFSKHVCRSAAADRVFFACLSSVIAAAPFDVAELDLDEETLKYTYARAIVAGLDKSGANTLLAVLSSALARASNSGKRVFDKHVAAMTRAFELVGDNFAPSVGWILK